MKRSVSLQLGARLSCAPLASLMKMRTLATRWKDLEERRRRAAEMASGDADAGGDICVLSGEFFAEAWLDQPYVKWCCEHMHIHEVSGNRLAELFDHEDCSQSRGAGRALPGHGDSRDYNVQAPCSFGGLGVGHGADADASVGLFLRPHPRR